MTAIALDFGAAEAPKQHGRLQLTDRELVRRLRLRDGALSLRSPAHLLAGSCKYAAQYPGGDCPWCVAIAQRRESIERALLALWAR